MFLFVCLTQFLGCTASYGWILEWEQMAQEEDWLVGVKTEY